jgi:hypothetical protein
MGKGGSRAARNNRSNQMNPRHPAYSQSRQSSNAENVNRSMQLNPQTETYQSSRGTSNDASGTVSQGAFAPTLSESNRKWLDLTDQLHQTGVCPSTCPECGKRCEAEKHLLLARSVNHSHHVVLEGRAGVYHSWELSLDEEEARRGAYL